MATIDATVGGVASNSYLTEAEAEAYFATRLPLAGWENAIDKSVQLIMATRLIDRALQPIKVYVPAQGGVAAFYRVGKTWSGAPASLTQRLAWPRTGMVNLNGVTIPSNVIPEDLKFATAELAGQLGTSDRTLDNDVVVQGLTSVRAGSVSLTFKDYIEPKVIPDAVWNLMPPSWFTDEVITFVGAAEEVNVVSE